MAITLSKEPKRVAFVAACNYIDGMRHAVQDNLRLFAGYHKKGRKIVVAADIQSARTALKQHKIIPRNIVML